MSGRGLVVLAGALALAALGVSAYLSVQSLTGQAVAGCGGDKGCGAVLASPWSKFGPVPVSLLGSAAYLVVLTGLSLRARSHAKSKLGDFLLLASAPAMLIAAAWFTYIQLAQIGEVCAYCMVDHGIGVVLGVMLPAIVLGQSALKPAMPMMIGLLSSVGFFAVQHATLDHSVQTTTNYFVDRDGDKVIDGKRQISMFGGELQFALEEVPHYGNPRAEQVVGLVFDYACPHCRKLHLLIDEAIEQDSKRFAAVPLPITILEGRNPYIASDDDRFKESEERAMLALAVAAVDIEKWRTFDRWLFSHDSGSAFPRSAQAARAKAVELIGEPALSAQLSGDPAAKHRTLIERNIELLSIFSIDSESNPQLRIPVVTAPGAPHHIHEGFYDFEVLEQLLQESRAGLKASDDLESNDASP